MLIYAKLSKKYYVGFMIQRNLTLFQIDNFLGGFWPLSAVAIIYFEMITHSYAEAMLVFSIINFGQSIFEIPTGILSDKIGRKYSMTAACALILGGYTAWAIAGDTNLVWLLYIGAALVGCGQAFGSGTDDAFAFETIKEMGRTCEFDRVYSRNKSFDSLGLAVSAMLATVVFYFSPINTLAWISVVPALLRVVVSFFYVEPKCVERPKESGWKHFLKSLKLLSRRPKLMRFALVKSFNYSFNSANWRFVGAYYETLIAPWLINVVRIVQELMGFIGFHLVRFVKRRESKKVLFLSVLINALIKMAGVMLNAAVTPFIMVSSTLCYGISSTVENTLLQKQLTDRQRATMGSVISLFAGFLSVLVFMATGFIADYTSARAAIFLLIFMRIAVAFAYKRIFSK